MHRIPFQFLLPWLAISFIIIIGGGLGISFMILETTAAGEWAVVALGVFLVVCIPTAGAILAKRFGSPEE